MEGTIVQVNISPGGLPKRADSRRGFIYSAGLEGDRHAHPEIHGGPNARPILHDRRRGRRRSDRARLSRSFYGALGENLTTRGLDIRDLRIGDQLRAGGAMLEITQPRGPCPQLDVYGRRSSTRSTTSA